MAEVNKTASAPQGTRAGAGFELRLERGGASVRLADQPIATGVRLESLTLLVPDVRFPFDVGAGAQQFKSRLNDLAEISVAVEPAAAEAAIAAGTPAALGVEGVALAFRAGFAEIAGRLSGGPAFTMRAGLVPEGERGVGVVFHSPLVLGPAPLPAGALPHLARAVLGGVGVEAALREALPALLRLALAPRGWKLPRPSGVRLVRAEVAEGLVKLGWDRGASAPPAPSDPDLLAALDGARAFPGPEALLARGEHAAAREAWLRAGPAAAGHPFAADRLLSLLVLDDRFHDEALDLAAGWLARRPGFPPALAAEAQVRLARGESGRAARALAALAAGAASRGETFAALAAAEAALELRGAPREELLPAVETALAVRRDHVPALRALRDLALAGNDREALLRADRRLVAYDPDDAGKARAHAELGELLLEADPPAARHHLDQALRLAPEEPEALAALARACAAAGEPLRAARSLDQLRDLHAARGDRAAAAGAAVRAGALWETALGHPENALLRYREACELAPSAEAHARAARAASAAGQWAEAADHHAAVLASLDRSAPGAAELALATRLALAEVAEVRLADAAAAAAHLEEATRLAPDRADLLERLAALLRTLDRPAALGAALARLAPLVPEPRARAAALAEAGSAALAAGRADEARSRFAQALAADASSRAALAGLADLAAARGDAAAERDALARLVPLASSRAEAAELQERLSSALERAGDVSGAAAAAEAARALAPTPARLDAALRRARRAGEPLPLSALLAERARAGAAAGDAAGAAAAWLERAGLLAAPDPAAAHAALAEARAAAPGDPAVLRAQAELAERTGDPRLALGALRALLAGAPADGPALHLRAARAALAAGEPGAAREHAERALDGGEAGADAILLALLEHGGDGRSRAALLLRLGRHLEAAALHAAAGDRAEERAALERAAEVDATAAEALPRLAALCEAAGDAPGAARALLALARRTPGRTGAALALRAHDLAGDAAALDLAAALDPGFAPPRARRALALAAGDAPPAAALAEVEAALAGDALDPARRPALHEAGARLAGSAGDRASLRRHLAALVELGRGDDALLARLADEHRAAGDRAALALALERRVALAAGPEAAGVRAELASLLVRSDPARAAALAEEALALDPGSLAALRLAVVATADPALRAERLAAVAAHAGAGASEAAEALLERARLLAPSDDGTAALEALREAARRAPLDDLLLERRAALAARADAAAEAADALLERAERARDRGEPLAAERLAEAGLALLAAGGGPAPDARAEEGEAILREALALEPGPERETARAAREALAALARERGDGAGEAAQLAPLVPLLPTGARPAALLRLSSLALAAGDPAAARAHAEEARTLAPRDPAAAEAARAAAEAAGDRAAVADLLGALAALEPASAGPRLLERARLLEALGRAEDADAAHEQALAALPPDRGLAEAHALLRRSTGRPEPSAPLEAFALRAPGPDAPRALRAAAALALEAGDPGAALRCARRAFARTKDDPGFAGPLLARILYRSGSAAEALVVHRRLAPALEALPADEQAGLLAQLAELAEDASERDLALDALDRLLALRPHDADAALRRFALDPDRRRAAVRLAEAGLATRSGRQQADLLARAAEGALAEAGDRELSDELFARALGAAQPVLADAARVARRRAAALLAAEGERSEAYAEALRDQAAAAQAAGDRADARAALERAVAVAEARGHPADAARDLLQLDALAAADGEWDLSAAFARRAAAAQRDAGDLDGAEETLRTAVAAAPGDDAARLLLEEVVRAREEKALERLALAGDHAGRAEILARRAAESPLDAAVARAAADAFAAAGKLAEAVPHLEAAVRADPGDDVHAERLLLALADRPVERAELLRSRAERLAGEARAARLREAAEAFLAAGDAARAADAHRDAFEAWPADGAAFAAALAHAAPDPERIDAVLAARARAVPADAAACHRARGDALAAFGELERAIAAYEAALAAGPEDAATLAALGSCLALSRGDEAALEVDARLVAAVERDPEALPASAEAPSRYRLGLAAFGAGRPGDGTAHLERALLLAATDPRAGIAWTALARGHEARGDTAAALAAARARADRAQALGLHEERGLALEAAAELCDALGDPGSVAAELLEALVAFRADAGVGGEALAPLARRAAALLDAAGEPRRARVTLARAGIGGTETATATETPTATPTDLPAELPTDLPTEIPIDGALDFDGWSIPPLDFDALPPEAPPEPPLDGAAPRPDAPPAEPTSAGPAEPAPPTPVASGAEQPAHDGAEPLAFVLARAAAERALSTDDPVARARAYAESAEELYRAGAAADEVRAALTLACDADPDGAAPWSTRARLEAALGEPLAAARAYLSAAIRAEGEEAAAAALQAARLFEGAGRGADAARAYRAAEHARPGSLPDAGWAALQAGDPESAAAIARESADTLGREAAEAVDAVESARLWVTLGGLLAERLDDHAGAIAALRAGLFRARGAGEAGRAVALAAADSLASLGAPAAAAAGDEPAAEAPPPDDAPEAVSLDALDVADEADQAPTATPTPTPTAAAAATPAAPPDLAERGREHMRAAEWQEAHDALAAALAMEPTDVTLARDLGRVAERLGLFDEYVQLGEVTADAIAAYDPLAAAARYRHFAEVLRTRLGQPDRAAVMLEKALALVPTDPDARRELVDLWSLDPASAPRAIGAWAEIAARDPADLGALRALAALCARVSGEAPPAAAARVAERGRLASALAAFVGHAPDEAPPSNVAGRVPADVRARVAAPGATGPLARLLTLLTPWLEPLFPADLARRGVAPGIGAAPPLDLRDALEAATRALGGRPHALFASPRPGVELALENTQPPAIVAGPEVALLGPAGRDFVAARAVDLLANGWALAGKFAPRDVGILLELACRFGGGAPPSAGLPSERAGAFLRALEASVPDAVRRSALELGAEAAAELAATEARAFAAALRRTANRVALLYAGDPGAALAVLARLDRRLGSGPAAPADVLALPDLRDLALFALSEPFLDLRLQVAG